MPASPFVVPVAALRRRLGLRRHEVRRGPIADLRCGASEVDPATPVEVDVELEAVAGGAVVVEGTVTATWRGECRRCLAPAGGTLRLPVRELCTENGDGDETYPLADGTVDLEPLARDAVLLELPGAPLCRSDCQGLCPSCGADRNQGSCSCAPPADARWSALDVLRDG